MKIFVINGSPQSGKTTFGQLVGKSLEQRGIQFIHTSSIELVKKILAGDYEWICQMCSPGVINKVLQIKGEVTQLNWDGTTKNEEWREKMSIFKQKLSTKFPNMIHEYCMSRAENVESSGVLFVDIREPSNIEAFRRYVAALYLDCELMTVLIVSPDAEIYYNESDLSVDKFAYDIEIKT